jgi:hypothetical protein
MDLKEANREGDGKESTEKAMGREKRNEKI